MILTIGNKIIMPKANTWADGAIQPPEPTPPDPYNPLNLPPNTVRVRTSDGNVPTSSGYTPYYESATLVSGTSDVYDVYKSGVNFNYMLAGCSNVVEVLGANTTGVTSMKYMFIQCTYLTTVQLFDTSSVTDMTGMFSTCSSLTTIPLFDTSKVTSMEDMFRYCSALTTVPLLNTASVTTMYHMFSNCTSLTSVPLFNTSNVTNMYQMFLNCGALTAIPLFDTSKVTEMSEQFKNCRGVQSGALALYQQASSQANPPTWHSDTFLRCGSNTTTGAAELAQIPTSWGGTLS